MAKKNYLGEIIFANRKMDNLTQDEYGAKYGVSGPAVFKFEKGYVRPSLELWMKMASDAQLSERRSVLLWMKSKLPEAYQDYIEMQSAAVAESEAEYAKKRGGKKTDYSKVEGREQMLELTSKDKTIPSGLKALLEDVELWALYKPTGLEVNFLRDKFGPLGRGSKSAYREALRLVREFA